MNSSGLAASNSLFSVDCRKEQSVYLDCSDFWNLFSIFVLKGMLVALCSYLLGRFFF